MTKTQILTGQVTLSAAIAAITDKIGILFYMLVVFSAVMVIDFISGMAASKKEAIEHPGDKSYGWSSEKGLLGILKKGGYIFVVMVAIFVDYMIFRAGTMIGVNMPSKTFFALLVTAWYICNECLSIIENAGRMGAEIPYFLKDIISVLKDGTEKKGGDMTGQKEA